MKKTFDTLFSRPTADNGFKQPREELANRYPTNRPAVEIGNGDVLIAAITSCTNTSNPGVLLAAGLLAKKAAAAGLRSNRTSRPRSRRDRAWSPST